MKRIAVIYPHANIDTNPTMMQLIEDLASEGFFIDVFLNFSESFLKPTWNNTRIRVFPINEQRDNFTVSSAIYELHKKEYYSAVLGCNPEGLIAAHPIALRLGIPLVYISFEIYFFDELKSDEDIELKQLEIEASRIADLVIIQDEMRAGLLSRENNINLSKFVMLPVAPKGPAKKRKSDFLRKKFQIKNGRIIVLHSGRFNEATFGRQLVKAAHDWPNDYILVIHTRFKGKKSEYLLEEMNKSDPTKVKYSTEPMTHDKYDSLVGSCDIGLAFQKKMNSKFTQKNTYHIGLSSGKFSYYAKFGIPIITNRLPTYESLFRKYRSGCCVAEMKEIGDAIGNIISNYEMMSRNSLRLFNDKLDYNAFFPAVKDKLAKLIN